VQSEKVTFEAFSDIGVSVRIRMILIATAMAMTLPLGACAAEPKPTVSAAPVAESPSPTPTPVPTIEPPVVDSVVISSEAITLTDESGDIIEVFSYYDAEAAPLVDALNEAFDTDVEGVATDGGNHASYTLYDWDGLAIREFENEPTYPEQFRFNTYAETAEISGVQITAIGGVQIGWDSADVAPLAFETSVDTGTGKTIRFYSLDEVLVDVPYETYGGPGVLSTGIWTTVPQKKVYRIQAPGQNWGE